MLVQTMTNLERCNALFEDQPKIKIFAEKNIKRVVRDIKKAGHYPAWRWLEYTHVESRNQYLVCYCVMSAQDIEKPLIDYVSFMPSLGGRIVVKWGTWLYPDRGDECVCTRVIAYYTPHFFDMYRERIWCQANLSYYELLARYFSRNRETLPLELNDDIKEDYTKYGEFANYAFRVQDGICFTRQWREGDINTIRDRNSSFISVVFYNTIVNEGLLKDKQKIAIDKESFNYFKALFNNLILNNNSIAKN